MRESLRAYRVLISLGFKAAPREAALQLLSGMFFELSVPAVAFAGKLIVDAALAGDLRLGLAAGSGAALATGLSLLAVFFYVDWLFTVSDRSKALAARRLIRFLGGTQGLAHFERPEYQDQVQRIREEQGRLAGMVNATAGILRVIVILVITGLLLGRIHPLLLLLPLFGLLSFWFGKKSRDLENAAQEATSEAARLRRHLFEVGTAAPQAKELRLSALSEVIRLRHRKAAGEVLKAYDRAAWLGTLFTACGGLISALAFLGAVALSLWLAINRQATPGDVILTVGLAAQMDGVIFIAIAYGNTLLRVLRVGKRFLWLEDYAGKARRQVTDPAAPPEQLASGIELKEVTFRYPESERPVLDGLSLQLPAGKVVALVGENGAGKTTLIKLLCDFYQPEGGKILVDGVDLARFRPEDWRSRISAAFQDYSRFEFLARETVGVADLPRIEDRPHINRAIEKAGAEGLVSELPAGLETQLGTAWEGGVDLSGGQWQKLALGRGLVRSSPLLVVFDEPTAALDPPSEHALFERFAAAARAGQNRGQITLLVSHRFSTVRMADLILVLEGGKIREYGSHEELITRSGLYAELYELQSRAYRQAETGAVNA